VNIPPLSSEEPVGGPTLNDLRAAVDALKKPRRGEQVAEASVEEGVADEDSNSTHP
jgi:hypothetical protein